MGGCSYVQKQQTENYDALSAHDKKHAIYFVGRKAMDYL